MSLCGGGQAAKGQQAALQLYDPEEPGSLTQALPGSGGVRTIKFPGH